MLTALNFLKFLIGLTGDELTESESLNAKLSSLSPLLLLLLLLELVPNAAIGKLAGWLGPATPNPALD